MPNMMMKVIEFIRAYKALYGRDPPYIELSKSEMENIIEEYSIFYDGKNIEQITMLHQIPVRKAE